MRDMVMPFEPKPQAGLTGRTVLLMLFGFFGVVFAVNIYFVTVALETHTGVVAQEPYRKGLAYNNRIAADERQHELGWTADAGITPTGHVEVKFADKSGQPVTGLAVTAMLGRPATEIEDHRLTLKETAPGQYAAEGAKLAAGGYILTAEARTDGKSEPQFRLRKRLWLNP